MCRIWQDLRHPWSKVTFVMNVLVLSLNICKALKLCNDVYGMQMRKEGDVGEVVEGVGTKFVMNPTLRDLAHQYVLTNISIMTSWME